MELETIIEGTFCGFTGFLMGILNGIARDRRINFELELVGEMENQETILGELFSESSMFKGQSPDEKIYVLDKLYTTSDVYVPIGLGSLTGVLSWIMAKDPYLFPLSLALIPLPAYLGGVLGEKISKARRRKAKLGKKEIKLFWDYVKDYRQSIIQGEDTMRTQDALVDYMGKLINKKRNVELMKHLFEDINKCILYAEKYAEEHKPSEDKPKA